MDESRLSKTVHGGRDGCQGVVCSPEQREEGPDAATLCIRGRLRINRTHLLWRFIDYSRSMKNLSAALAMIIVCLLTGSAAAVFAEGRSVYAERAIAMSVAAGTGSEALQTHSVSSAVIRRLRWRTKLIEAVKNNPAGASGALSLTFAAESGATVFPDPTVSSGAKAIWIYLGIQEAVLTESGIVVKTYQISSGAPATPTPRGVFKIYKKEELRVSGQAVAYRMPYYLSFTKNSAFGLHALPYLGDSAQNSWYWSEALSHIGIPVSHGCVRFLPEQAVELYKWADRGIPVFIQT